MDLQTPRPSWWSRNWKWVVPVIVLAGILLAAVPVAAIYFFAQFFLHSMKSSGGYQEALAAARANSAVVQALGTPIKDGWFPSGNIESSGSIGRVRPGDPGLGPQRQRHAVRPRDQVPG